MLFKLRKTELFIALMLLGFLGILYQKFFLLPPLSADSWSYFEISKTIFFDFYRFSTFRSYENASAYGSSFPPLWPVLISVFNLIFDQGPRAGVLINILLLPLICFSLERLALKLSNIRFLGVIAFFITLSDSSFIDEVIAGRSIPLQILLLLNLFSLLIRKEKIVACGFLLGLCLMNRFDALVLVPAVILFLLYVKTSTKSLLGFLVTLFFTISPWIAYSLAYFGSPWKTDNSFVAKSVNRAYVTDWNPGPILTLRDDFLGWLGRILSNVYPLFNAYSKGLWELRWSLMIVFIALSLVSFVFVRISKGKSFKSVDIHYVTLLRAFCLFIGFGIFSLAPCLLTGYFDLRYFAFLRMIFMLLLIGGVFFLFNKRFDLERVVSLACLFLLPSLVWLGVSRLPEVVVLSDSDPLRPIWIDQVNSCLKQEDKLGVTFFPDVHNAFQFGAMSGNRTACLPENFPRLSVEDRSRFITSFGITHVVSSKDQNLLSSELGVSLDRVDCSQPLYKISKIM